jgi:hypothetical protein
MTKRVALLAGLVCLALACTQTVAEQGFLTEVKTFGTSSVTLDVDETGKVKTLMAEGQGTNAMKIFSGLWDMIGRAASGFFGSPEAPEINIHTGTPEDGALNPG